MTYPGMPARLATVVAEQPQLTAMWNGACTSRATLHVARLAVGPQLPPGEADLPELVRNWAGACEDCGTPVPWDDQDVRLSGGIHRAWDTPSGRLEPGCLYWADDWDGLCMAGWTNCDGRHLHALLPNGHQWDIDSRARNCGLPEDGVHRCWVRTGEPPAVDVGKGGVTCSAGAGSILSGDYHGFLRHGAFTAG